MRLQEQIREDMLAAMKAKEVEKLSLLRVVAGELGRYKDKKGMTFKVLTDEQALEVLCKMSENANEMGNQNEVRILEKYIPKVVMLGEYQIKTIVGGIIQKNQYTSMQDMGKVMGTLKSHPMSVQIDNKLASVITKELLTQ